MGWLRDLLLRSEPPVGSLGELARRALGHPAWPASVQIQQRSLAALLSKLDRSQELDWLRDRPDALDCLALVLGRPSSELRVALGDAPVRRDRRMLRLHDLRFSRDVDLVREELPPGFPDDLKHPVRWGSPLIWVAPSGAGRTWFAAYLEARGLANVGQDRGGTSLNLLPDYGPVFVDLGPKTQVDSKQLERLRASTRPVCLAVTSEAQLTRTLREATDHPSKPRIVHSPEPATYLEALAKWAEERLSGDGYFDAERASAWVKRTVLTAEAATTFGEILGFLGLSDELSPRQLSTANLPQVLKLFVRRRLRDARETTPISDEQLVSMLVEASVRVYLEKDEDLAMPRTASAWIDLFSTPQHKEPERHSRTARIDLVPHGLFRALQSAGLMSRAWQPLGTQEDELYQLAPHCLTSLLRSLAYDEILSSAPEVWGRGLLLANPFAQAAFASPKLAPGTLWDRLMDRARAGNFQPFRALIEGPSDPTLSVDYVSALEGSVESLGMACLMGHSVQAELCHDVLREYGRYLVRIDDVLAPRLRKPEDILPGLLALSLEASGLPPELDPLRCADDSLLTSVTTLLFALARGAQKERAPLLLALLARSWQARGGVASTLGPPEAATLSCLMEPNPTPEVAWLALDAFALDVLEKAREACSLSPSGLFLALWQAISKYLALDPKGQELKDKFAQLSSDSAGFWRIAPGEALASAALGPLLRFDLLLPHQHDALLSHLPLPLPARAVQAAPLDVALGRLDKAGPDIGDDALATLFERAKRRTARCLLQRYLREHDAASLAALLAHQQFITCLPELPTAQELTLLPAAVLDGLRRALIHACQTTREPEPLAQAFQRASELEQALRPLLRARKAPLSSSDRAGS